MEAYDSIKKRKSIRGFKDEPIKKEILKKIIEAARNSPSYANTQPWEMVIIGGTKIKELTSELLKLEKERVSACPDIPFPHTWPREMEKRLKEHGVRRFDALGIDHNNKEEKEKLRLMNYKFYGAPYAIFLFMDESLGEWSLFDMGLFTQNLILAANSLGVGSCIQASVTQFAKEIKRFLHIPPNKKLVVCISIGYPDPEAEINTYRSRKKDLDEFVYWFE